MNKKPHKKSEPATKKDIELLHKDLRSTNKNVALLHKDSRSTEKDIRNDIELMGGNLAFQIEEVRQENNERFNNLEQEFREVKKSVDMNTEAMSMLTQELREVKNIEFTVYNHEQRITILEKR